MNAVNLTTNDAYDLARQIVPFMPGTWVTRVRGDACNGYAEIVRVDGATICLHTNGYGLEGRVSIGCEFPKYHDGRRYDLPHNVKAPSITCSVSKKPEQIARDIQRRVLPEYIPLFEKAAFDVARVALAQEGAYQAACRIASALGIEKPGRPDTAHASVVLYPHFDDVYTITVHQDDPPMVTFDVRSVTEEKAIEILKIIGRGRP